jgi:competence CoiA-like predicted nuclease
MTKGLKKTFCIINGDIQHISNVDTKNTKTGDFKCPHCSSTLIDRMGPKVKPHFAHFNAPVCNNSLETAFI